MLTETDIQEIRSHLAHYPQKRAACVEALKAIQKRYRWVNDEHLAQLAALLDMTADELDSVATFYNLIYRQPIGRHVVLLCDSVSCWIMGYETVLAHLLKRLGVSALGQTSPDDRFTLLPTACLGACDHAPAMMIDDELYGDLNEAMIDSILRKYD